ncbi:MAG: hypothetical protein U9N34_02170 [Candidatus Cloacimonadota bacterium]|nr:hypothetical protein [Candidatus Cloacimonadota bacterium]
MLENREIVMTPEEKVNAIKTLKSQIETNFVGLGQLLSELKRTKIHKRKGYKNFKELVENEFQFANSFASKLITNYNLFVRKKDLDDESMKEIGLDKLNIIKPVVKDADIQESDSWIEKAKELNTSELREEVKLTREKQKEKDKTVKDMFTEQYLERMVSHFNCNRKNLDFKLALYFQEEDLFEMQKVIERNQEKFDLENPEELLNKE